MSHSFRLIGLIIICALLICICGTLRLQAGEEMPANPEIAKAELPNKLIKVFVSILPQQFFVERIGGDRVEVEVLVPPGQSPATYAVTAKQMARLAEADLYFRVNVPFEKAFIPKIKSSMKNLLIEDSSRSIRPYKISGSYYPIASDMEEQPEYKVKVPAKKKDQAESEHPEEKAEVAVEEEADKHAEEHFDGFHMEDRDPHTWMAPLFAMSHCETIARTLMKFDPEGKEYYKANVDALRKEMKALHHHLYKVLRPIRKKMFITFHPAFGYFARAYGLWQLVIEEEGKPPSAKRLAELIDIAKEKDAKIIFVQEQFNHKAAQTIADEIGGTIIKLDPLAKDYINNMRSMADKIEALLREQKPEEKASVQASP